MEFERGSVGVDGSGCIAGCSDLSPLNNYQRRRWKIGRVGGEDESESEYRSGDTGSCTPGFKKKKV